MSGECLAQSGEDAKDHDAHGVWEGVGPFPSATSVREVNLIDQLLFEQRALTAVEWFARRHDNGDAPAQARYYRDLIQLSKPTAGQQYAFAVDLDKCTGCKACVSACHSLNGLEEHETWRDVGLLVGEREPYLQTVTTACHHCAEPACLDGCPVMAYEKDAETGIVRHLDDQCIGCQYCTMKCPYDVPKYSKRLGIVRKCDMCHDRLAVGEAPACVQACPHEAISIRTVNLAEVSAAAQPGAGMVPGAFDSSYTKPTTQYSTRKPVPRDAQPADAHALRLEHAHWPLIIMLVLSQMAAGAFVMLAAIGFASAEQFRLAGPALSAFALPVLIAGLAASVFHLGRPLGAWRFFLGLRTSWMSREILVFGLFAGAAVVAAGLCWFAPGSGASLVASAAAASLGLAAVFTSAMIYVDTRRAFWRPSLTFGKFYGTALLLGATAAAAVTGWADRFHPADMARAVIACAIVATIIRTVLFAWETGVFIRALRRPHSPIHRSAETIRVLLPWIPGVRAVLFSASTALSLMAILGVADAAVLWASVAFVTTLSSQLLERCTFFTAVHAPRMPGGV
jgi:formate dehydrogenase iron-sulfur subunit